MTAENRPSWCRQCRQNPTDPGYAVCGDCAFKILYRTCTHPDQPELVILRTANGYQQPRLRCRRCAAKLGTPKLRDVNPAEADMVVLSQPRNPGAACARCGRRDAIEVHHWAPWHLFDDAHMWPTSPLCPDCHRLWHRVTRTDGSRPVEPPEAPPVELPGDWSGPF